jgi:hypothetical protein
MEKEIIPMSNDYYDQFLCESWNKIVPDCQLPRERFWDICRIFEENGYLQKNHTAVTTFSIGPFRIATNLSIEKKDMLLFFAEVVIPALVTESQLISFEDKWQYILLPLTHICINLLDKTCYIKDKTTWRVLLYIKKENSAGHNPTLAEIKLLLPEKEQLETEEIVRYLLSFKGIIDTSNALVEKVNDGYKSLV